MATIVKSPFKDALETMVPEKGTSGGQYDTERNLPDTAGRDGGLLRELYRDTAVSDSKPSTSGPLKTPFKDAV